MSGLFIAIEGPDGAGKSTGIGYLKELAWLFQEDVVFTREPGGTKAAEELRSTLLSVPMHSLSEVMTFTAGRVDHFFEVINPAVKNNQVIISDRYIDSSYAYQAYGRGLLDMVNGTHELFRKQAEKENAKIDPDIVLYFDIPFELSQERLNARKESKDVFESEQHEFYKKVFDGYQKRMDYRRSQPGCTVHVIDATQDIQGVKKQLKEFFVYNIIHRKRK